MYGPSSLSRALPLCVFTHAHPIYSKSHTHTRIRIHIFIYYLYTYRYARAFRCLIIMHWTSPDDFKSKLHNFKRFFLSLSQHASASTPTTELSVWIWNFFYKLTLCKYISDFVIFWYLLWINWLWFGQIKSKSEWTKSLCLRWFLLLLFPLLLLCSRFYFTRTKKFSFVNEKSH